MSEPQNKDELLVRLRAERDAWDQLLLQIPRERLSDVGVTEQWAVRDLVAHLTAWESRPIAWLTAARDGGRPQPPAWPRDRSEDETNAWIYNAARARSLDEVLAESCAVSQQLIALVEKTPEGVLTDNARFAWLEGKSLLEVIGGNTYEHYGEHAEQARAWWRRQGAPA